MLRVMVPDNRVKGRTGRMGKRIVPEEAVMGVGSQRMRGNSESWAKGCSSDRLRSIELGTGTRGTLWDEKVSFVARREQLRRVGDGCAQTSIARELRSL